TMNNIAIMTDTLSGMPKKMAKELNIKLVPLHIITDGKSYEETEVDN
ncbi:unnamed protein product, partial [marine sediment metagenome]